MDNHPGHDEQVRDLHGLNLQAVFTDAKTKKEIAAVDIGKIENLPYYETIRQPIRISIPQTKDARQYLNLVLRLSR